MQTVASDLIAQFGQAMTLLRTTPGTFDPVTGQVTGAVEDSIAVTGIASNFDANEIDGTRILATDVRASLTAAQEPQISDRLVIGGREHEIVNIVAKNPAGTALVYIVQARAL